MQIERAKMIFADLHTEDTEEDHKRKDWLE